MSKNTTLSRADRLILESCGKTIENLSLYFGPAYEFVLHSLEDHDHSVVKIANGHFSSRSEGDPLTNVALDMLQKIEAGDEPKGIVYSTGYEPGSSSPIRSTTIPIQGERGKIIGLLCINMYTTISLDSFLVNLFTAPNSETATVEQFSTYGGDPLMLALEDARNSVYNNPSIPANNKIKTIVSILNEKGLFNLKDAVVRVAENLNVSKNTIYMHLRNQAK